MHSGSVFSRKNAELSELDIRKMKLEDILI